MKILKSILFLALFASLTSCGSDDEPAFVLSSDTFSGEYQLVFLETTDVETQLINGGTIVTTTKIVGDTFTNSTITFNSNGNYSLKSSFRATNTTSVTGNPSVTDTEIINDTDSGQYVLDAANRTVTVGGLLYSITVFNENELRIKYTENITINGVVSDINSELRFTR